MNFGIDLQTAKEKIEINQFKEALELLNHTIIKGLEKEEAYYLRGILKNQLQDFGGAINDFYKVLEMNPNNTLAKQRIELIMNILDFRNMEMYNV
jgi:tetratricopeptide (TPR) repeat protein